MLIIRKPQLEILTKEPREAFIRGIIRNIRETFSEQFEAIGDESSTNLIRKAVDSGEALGFKTHRELTRFVSLFFRLGPDFELRDETEWVLDELADENASPADRLDRIDAKLEKGPTGREESDV